MPSSALQLHLLMSFLHTFRLFEFGNLDLAIGSSTSIPSIVVGMVVEWDLAHT
jgi:hypothetical protein